MPISGLAITLSTDPAERGTAMNAMRTHPNIDVGPAHASQRVPVVVETADSDEDRQVWQWLHELPGVQFVDVVYVHFDQEQDHLEVDLKS